MAEPHELLRRAHLRVTTQRLMIIKVLRERGGHVSAATILEAVQADFPMLNASTVYRTLRTLADCGIVNATGDLNRDVELFEWSENSSHHHLVCSTCSAELEVDDGLLTALSAVTEKLAGFRLTGHHYVLPGQCAQCAAEAKRSTGTGEQS